MSTTDDYCLIEDNIFLGNLSIAINAEELKKLDIKRVLTIGIKPIVYSKQVPNVYYKHIPALNEDIEELVVHFLDCFGFISEAQSYDENVLIHCLNGQSISACVLVSYLMKKYRIGTEVAVNRVAKKRAIRLNKGFVHQLNVWQKMSFVLIGNYSDLRHILFRSLRQRIRQMIEILYSNEEQELFNQSLNKYFRNLWKIEENDESFRLGKGYLCRKCRRLPVLFYECHVFGNEGSVGECNVIYAQPESWNIGQITQNLMFSFNLILGPIQCRNCTEILGQFDWSPNKDVKKVCNCALHKGLDTLQVFQYYSTKVIKTDN